MPKIEFPFHQWSKQSLGVTLETNLLIRTLWSWQSCSWHRPESFHMSHVRISSMKLSSFTIMCICLLGVQNLKPHSTMFKKAMCSHLGVTFLDWCPVIGVFWFSTMSWLDYLRSFCSPNCLATLNSPLLVVVSARKRTSWRLHNVGAKPTSAPMIDAWPKLTVA